nr:XisH family protein [Oscillatoria acuminata]
MAKDRFHQVVKTALESDGWTVTHAIELERIVLWKE